MCEMASSVDSIGAIGKLKRVQSNRDGGANVALNKSLKNLHDYRCEGHWTIVIQARRGLLFLGTGMMMDFLKEVGTTEVARDSLKIEVNRPAS